MSNFISVNEYAKIKGVNSKSVRKAIDSGRVVTVEQEGKLMVNVEESDQVWDANRDEEQVKTPMVTQSSLEGKKFAEIRTRKLGIETRLKTLKVMEIEGTLLSADAVRKEAFSKVRIIRNGFLALPDRCAGVLSGMSDPQEIHRYIADEIHKILEGLKFEL